MLPSQCPCKPLNLGPLFRVFFGVFSACSVFSTLKDVLVAETRSPCFSRFFVNLSVAILWERYESNEHARKAADKIAYRELHPDEVSFDELLRWFLETGRSYLPHREYPPQADLSDPSPQQVSEITTDVF